jgi:hypothetical protein
MLTIHLTPKSSNAKTGPIAVTTSDARTCPVTCPFYDGGGCYAASGPLKLHWDKVTAGERGGDWIALQDSIAAAKLKPGSLLRHNQAGDLPQDGNGYIQSETVKYLTAIFTAAKLKAFTYTHHVQNAFNLGIVKRCNSQGFTVNLSCDSEAQAAKRHREGYPSVCVVPSDDTRRSWETDGVKFQTCPADLKEGVTCSTCKLCTLADRSCVVAFRAHGTGKRKVSERLSA